MPFFLKSRIEDWGIINLITQIFYLIRKEGLLQGIYVKKEGGWEQCLQVAQKISWGRTNLLIVVRLVGQTSQKV